MRPLRSGVTTTPRFSSAVTSVRSLGGHSIVTAEAEIVDGSGAHVVTAISTLVIVLEDPAANTLTFTLDIKFVDYTDNLGDDNAMISSLPFVAGVHAGAANMIAMSRTAAP